MKNKPIVAVTPLFDDQPGRSRRIFIQTYYMDAITRAGGIPVLLPLDLSGADLRRLVEAFDGFLITGGPDVDPALYREEALPCCGTIDPARDRLETLVVEEALRQGKPLLGACRGMQLINVALGGTLYQDIIEQRRPAVRLNHCQLQDFEKPIHNVIISRDSPLYSIVGTEFLSVNSMHHQAVKDLAPRLRVSAESEDGLVEALYMEGESFVVGVQWHPECMAPHDGASMSLFTAFIASCDNQKGYTTAPPVMGFQGRFSRDFLHGDH